MTTTVCGGGCLTHPDGDDGAELANTETDDDSADDELGKAERGSLDSLADQRADGREEDDIAAAELVASVGTRQGADEGANDKGRNNEALERRLSALLSSHGVDDVDLGERLDPILLAQKATDAGLVVAEERKGRGDNQRELQSAQGGAADSEILGGLHCSGGFFGGFPEKRREVKLASWTASRGRGDAHIRFCSALCVRSLRT